MLWVGRISTTVKLAMACVQSLYSDWSYCEISTAVPIYFSERNFPQSEWLGSLWSWKPHHGVVTRHSCRGFLIREFEHTSVVGTKSLTVTGSEGERSKGAKEEGEPRAWSWFSMKHRLDCLTLVADLPGKEHWADRQEGGHGVVTMLTHDKRIYNNRNVSRTQIQHQHCMYIFFPTYIYFFLSPWFQNDNHFDLYFILSPFLFKCLFRKLTPK